MSDIYYKAIDWDDDDKEIPVMAKVLTIGFSSNEVYVELPDGNCEWWELDFSKLVFPEQYQAENKALTEQVEVLEKALELASKDMAYYSGTCPLDSHDENIDCENTCGNDSEECYYKMYTDQAKQKIAKEN